MSFDSYIKPQLTVLVVGWVWGCMSFDSYIKPQLSALRFHIRRVVCLLIPTSNHNDAQIFGKPSKLYVF